MIICPSSMLARRSVASKFATATLMSVFLSGCSNLQTLSSNTDDLPKAGTVKTSALNSSGSNDSSYIGRDRIRRHIYAGIGAGASRLTPDASGTQSFDVNDRVHNASALSLGMDLSKTFAIDLQAVNLGAAGFSPNGSIDYDTFTASALVYAGKNRHRFKRTGLSAFGRLGVGYLRNETDGVPFVQENGAHLLFGFGGEFMTRMGLGFRAEFITYDEDISYGQLGLIYRFGREQTRQPVQTVADPIPLEPEPVAVIEPTPEPKPEPVVATALPEPSQCVQLNGVLDGVNFHSDSDQLTDASVSILSDVALQLSKCPVESVTISAHTDSQGSESYNSELSQRRADSVLRYLDSQGLDTSNMTSTAFGESSPIAPNDTREGRAQNRRVELFISE